MQNDNGNKHKGNQNAAGHQKPRNGNLMYGDGCYYAPTCFKCPLLECVYDPSNMSKLKRGVIK